MNQSASPVLQEPHSPLAGAAARPTKVRFAILAFVASASASAYLTRQCLGVANTTIASELGLSLKQMGWIGSAYAFGYLVFQVPGGWLGNRYGTRAALAGISVAWSAFTFWTAAAFGFLGLFTSRVFFGLAQAGLVPISSKAVKDWFPLSRRGSASSVITASMSMGSVVAIFLTAQLMQFLHWRTIFALYSFVGIVWSLGYYWFFRTDPAEHAWVNDAELALIKEVPDTATTEAPAAPETPFAENADGQADNSAGGENPYRSPQAAAAEASLPETEPPLATVLWCLLTSLSLWGVCLQVFFRAAGYTVFVFWLPAILEKGYGVTPVTAGFLAGFPPIGVVLGSLMGGPMIDYLLQRTGSKYISRSVSSFVCLALAAVISLLAAATSSPYLVVAALTAGIVFWSLANPSTWVATMDIAGKDTAIVMGIMNMAGTLGGITLPIALGYLLDDLTKNGGDWNIVIYIISAIQLLPALCWLMVNPNQLCTRPRVK